MNATQQQIQQFNRLILGWLATAHDRAVTDLSVDIELVWQLRHQSSESLGIENRRPLAMIDNEVLRQIVQLMCERCRDERQIDESLRLGARHAMLEAFTGMSREQFRERLKALGMLPKPRGRIELLSEKEEVDVQRCWHKLRGYQRRELGKLCAVSACTGLTLDRIWASFGGQLPDG